MHEKARMAPQQRMPMNRRILRMIPSRSVELERPEHTAATDSEADRARRSLAGHAHLDPQLLARRTPRGIGHLLGEEVGDRLGEEMPPAGDLDPELLAALVPL